MEKITLRWKQRPNLFKDKILKNISSDTIKDAMNILNKDKETICSFFKDLFVFNDIDCDIYKSDNNEFFFKACLNGRGKGKTLLYTVSLKPSAIYMALSLIAIKSNNTFFNGKIILIIVMENEDKNINLSYIKKELINIDTAIIGDSTNYEICHAHPGFVSFEVKLENYKSNENIILLGSSFVMYLNKVLNDLITKSAHPLMNYGKILFSSIEGESYKKGNEGYFKLLLERTWLPHESFREITSQIQDAIDVFKERYEDVNISFKEVLTKGIKNSPLETGINEEVIESIKLSLTDILNLKPKYNYYPKWSYAAVLKSQFQIPSVIFAPKNIKSNIDDIYDAITIYSYIIYKYLN